MQNNKQFWTVEKFFERLEFLLKNKGWTLNQLSIEADLGSSSIYQMKSRNTLPSLFSLCCICDALEISLTKFFEINEIKDFDEKQLISTINLLTPEKKKIIMQLLEQLK